MSGMISLNGTWSLTWAEGSHLMTPGHYTGLALRGRGLLPAAVPAPIHQVLQDAGLLDPPNLGLNSLKARWVEEAFWVYRHTFSVPADAACRKATWWCWSASAAGSPGVPPWCDGKRLNFGTNGLGKLHHGGARATRTVRWPENR